MAVLLREDGEGVLLSWPDEGGEAVVRGEDAEESTCRINGSVPPTARRQGPARSAPGKTAVRHLSKFTVVRLLPLFICFLQRPDR